MAQTFATGEVDRGDGASNVFSAADVGPDGKFYVLWKDGNFNSPISLTTPRFKLIRWEADTSTWTTLGTILGNTATFPNIISDTVYTVFGDRMSLKVDSQGRFHIAIHAFFSYGGAIVYGTSANGSSWTFTTIETSNNITNYTLSDPQLDLDPDGKPHVVFRISDSSNSDPTQRPTRIRRHVFNGSSWTGETVYSRIGSANAINNGVGYAIDSLGKGHLAIPVESNGSGTDASLYYLTNSSGTWSAPVNLAAGATSNAAVISLDLAVDAQDKVHIVRRDQTYNIHYHTNASGTWQGSQINGTLQGQIDYDSLTVNPLGDVLLAYNAHTGTNTGNVRYACLFNGQSTWQTGAVMTGNSRTGQYFSLAFKSDRTAMIMFDHFTGTGSPSYGPPNNPRQLQYATAAITPPASAPTLASSSADSLTSNSARISGEVLADGGAAITERGILVSVTQSNPNPQLGGSGVVKSTSTGTTGAFSVTATGLSPSTGYTFRTYATNSAGTTYSATGTFTTLELLSPIQAWRTQYFGNKANQGNGRNTHAPAGDGIPNLVKYALRLDPFQASAGLLPQPQWIESGATRQLGFSFHRDPARNDITLIVEASSDLVTWTALATSEAGAAFSGPGFVSESDAPGSLKLVACKDTASPATQTRRFMRIRVLDTNAP